MDSASVVHAVGTMSVCLSVRSSVFYKSVFYYKNSSGDEIANVNVFTTISHTYFIIPKKRTYFI